MANPATQILAPIATSLKPKAASPRGDSFSFVDAGMPIPPDLNNTAVNSEPTANSGCVLQPPPTTAKVGDVFAFNIKDWKEAVQKDKKELTFKVGLDPAGTAWVIKQYADLSAQKFRHMMGSLRSVGATPGNMHGNQPPKWNLITRTVTLRSASLGSGTFSAQYRGFIAPYYDKEMPRNIYDLGKEPGAYMLWRELIDGKEPIAKVDPPFSDSNHTWALYVAWTERMVTGVDPVTGVTVNQPEVRIVLRRLDRGILGTIEYGIGIALSVIKAVIQFVCKGITVEKLQDVRNYGTLFPSPTVQQVMVAWQGLAQACNLAFPPTATGAPNCGVTSEPPALPAPQTWWQQHQGWVIGGGLALVGAVGVVVFLKGRPTSG